MSKTIISIPENYLFSNLKTKIIYKDLKQDLLLISDVIDNLELHPLLEFLKEEPNYVIINMVYGLNYKDNCIFEGDTINFTYTYEDNVIIQDIEEFATTTIVEKNAKITLVSSTSIIEGGAHDVILKETNI